MPDAPWPRSYHPVTDGVPDTTVTVLAHQLRPDTWNVVADWCGATRILDGNGDQALALGALDEAHTVHLGDYVVLAGTTYSLERADGYFQRYASVDGP